MSEENVEELAEEATGDHDTGIRKQVGLGMNPHPITGEMGVTLRIGEAEDSETWMPYDEALQMVTQLQVLCSIGISTNAAMNMVQQTMQQAGNQNHKPGIVLPR